MLFIKTFVLGLIVLGYLLRLGRVLELVSSANFWMIFQ